MTTRAAIDAISTRKVLLTVKEAAAYLRYGKSTLDKLRVRWWRPALRQAARRQQGSLRSTRPR